MSERREKAAEAAIAKENEEIDKPAEVDPHDDRTREFRTLGFMRMRTDWGSEEDRITMASITKSVDARIMEAFPDAYQILNDLYEIVRVPRHDPETGEVMTDDYGWPLWDVTESGRFIEDYTKLGIKERENFIMQITVRLFEWEQIKDSLWNEAMFSKGEWESKYAHDFMDDRLGGKRSDEGFTQRARAGSREERYFAIYRATVSRKADSLVRSMDRIALRLSQSTR